MERWWDGQQWVRWDGRTWVPDMASSSPPPAPFGPSMREPTAWSRPVAPPAPDPSPPELVTWSRPVAPPPAAYWSVPTVVVTDRRDRPAMTVVAWIFTVLTGLYFLPWAIAASRGKADAGVVGWITFLLGWTVIGWIVALVMACTAHRVIGTRPAYY